MTTGLHSAHASATFRTQQASRHMTVLCRHFSQRVEASFTESSGHITFPFGTCDFEADVARLTLRASATDLVQLKQVIDVVTRHLERFAFRECPDLEWEISPFANPETSLKE